MIVPERKTVEKARKDKRAGKAPTTQAGEFVHEEIRKVRRTGRDRRSRRLRSACPRRGVRVLRSARRGKARPRRGLAKAPNTLMRRDKASGSLAVGPASRARCRGR